MTASRRNHETKALHAGENKALGGSEDKTLSAEVPVKVCGRDDCEGCTCQPVVMVHHAHVGDIDLLPGQSVSVSAGMAAAWVNGTIARRA